MRSAIAVSLLISMALLGSSTLHAAPVAAGDAHLERALSTLSRQSDADSLAAAGLLARSGHRDESLALFRRAVAADPARPDLAWLETLACEQTVGCDAEPVERQLRTLDPANGAGWLGALRRADARDDREAAARALTGLANSERIDIYWNPLVATLGHALASTKIMSPGEASVTVIGFLAAEAIPAYRDVVDACKSDRLQSEARLSTCRGIAKALEQGDTYLTQMLGASMAMRMWPPGSSGWQTANASRRTDQYQLKLIGGLDEERPNALRKDVALYARYRREQDVFKARLIEAGLNPDPPPNPLPGQ
jgi:hypothetical protein